MTRRATPRAGAAIAVAAIVALPAAAHAQGTAPRAYVRETGPGVAGRLLQEILARPHTVVVAPDTGIVFTRGTDVPTTLVVIGGPARLEGRVRGDFVVLGDLVLRPGAVVDGRPIAFGGKIANSTLAVVGGGAATFRDVAFVATETSPGVLALDYRQLDLVPPRTFTLPGVYGVRIPSYDRVNGLSVPFGPEIAVAAGRVTIDPTVTYRSQLGVVDGGIASDWRTGRRTSIEARASRGTFTNDLWMRGDIVNSAATLFGGSDARNYYRADRGELTISHDVETRSTVVTPFLGALIERARSAERTAAATSAPWSLFGRDDSTEGMRRPNPAVTGGTIAAAVVGARAQIVNGVVKGTASLRAEVPVHRTDGSRFTQLTADGWISFPTFRDQSFQALAHAVVTAGDRPPSQRYAYLGGSTTVPTLLLLEQGGDQLAWLQSRYVVPITRIRLPFVGSPSVMLRHIVGGAGVDRLPALTQNLGVRLSLSMLRLDYVFDPAHPDRHDLSVGVGVR